MYTIKAIANILNKPIINKINIDNKQINDFEYQAKYIIGINTAFISISKQTWAKWLGKEATIIEGNQQIKNCTHVPGLIITDEFISEYDNSVPQIVVEDAIEAMQILGNYFRLKFNQPVIAVTGSMGKSSTRIMIGESLNYYKVLQNRGNANTRVPVLLNLCKLIKNSGFAVFEISINGLNNKGNLSLSVKPDIAIVTGIGEAHLSTIKGTKDIAHFKARIFEGQNKNNSAIINGDTKHVDILTNKAHQYVNNINTYSRYGNPNINIVENKGYTTIELKDNHAVTSFTLNTISDGMISNVLATISVLQTLNVDVKACINNFENFKPFKKVLEMKIIKTPNLNTTLLDDTHNASLSAMINAIEAFNKQARFFKGHKIIVLDKISDLAKESEKLHLQLVTQLEQSNSDYILCLDNEMRKVVNRVRNKNITWYTDAERLLNDLQFLINEDGLTLLKSSVTGTDLPKIATRLFHRLQRSQVNYQKQIFFKQFPINRSHMYINYCNQVEYSMNKNISSSIEGLTPLIYYIYSQQRKISIDKVVLNSWFCCKVEFIV